MRYRRGTSRNQTSLLSINDLISSTHVVRIMDEICEEYCVTAIEESFSEKGTRDTGRKAYHPADLLKILVYGYFNGINSSRKLERESARNIELKWLTSDLVPDHKTIADFRRDNGDLINGLFTYLIDRFQQQGLLPGKQVAIDGTKVKAYASRELSLKNIAHRLKDIDTQVEKYFKDMQILDEAEDDVEKLREQKETLENDIEELIDKKKAYTESLEVLKASGEERISTTDPESKFMSTRTGKYWGYNVQTAVDAQHHLIASILVTDYQNDKGLLTTMSEESKHATEQKPEEVYADAGYYKIADVSKLESEGTVCYVGINRTPSQVHDQDNGLKFVYHKEGDFYECSGGKTLKFSRKKKEGNREGRVYEGIACRGCPLKERCTSAEARTIFRNDNQDWIDGFHEKMNSVHGKAMLIKRKSIVEHPFATMKYQMGQIPLLLRGKRSVQSEMNLHAIGYNLKRYMTLQNPTREQIRKTKLAA